MKAVIKSAQTAMYRGVYYRSRLEACWASWFDAHQIEFQYEQRYVTFADGKKYQPDFWLIHSRAWFEVKGALSTYDADKVSRLASYASSQDELVLMGGAPAGHAFGIIDGDRFDLNAAFGRCLYCDTWTVVSSACRQCGFGGRGQSVYIDQHESFTPHGCVSRCDIIGSVHTWRNDSPVPDRLRPEMQQWANDALREFSLFEIVPRRR